MNPVNFMNLIFPNKTENIGLARIAVASFASQSGFTVSEIEEIKVAISEAVSNAVIHAYSCEGTIEVSAKIYPDNMIEIIVEDTGKGIEDIDRAKESTFSTNSERMGLGFTFMESFSDELIVESKKAEGTKVIMKRAPGTKGENGENNGDNF